MSAKKASCSVVFSFPERGRVTEAQIESISQAVLSPSLSFIFHGSNTLKSRSAGDSRKRRKGRKVQTQQTLVCELKYRTWNNTEMGSNEFETRTHLSWLRRSQGTTPVAGLARNRRRPFWKTLQGLAIVYPSLSLVFRHCFWDEASRGKALMTPGENEKSPSPSSLFLPPRGLLLEKARLKGKKGRRRRRALRKLKVDTEEEKGK